MTSVQRVVDQLTGYGPERIILFGSAARGDADEHSDIDLIIVKETDTRFVRRAVEAGSFLSPDVSADLFVYTPAELEAMIEEGNPFIEEALREGKVVYGPAEEARRWLAQAQHSMRVTRVLLENGLWSAACFNAEQTAQLALKAFLHARGGRAALLDSVRELARECGKLDTDFLEHVAAGSTLDRGALRGVHRGGCDGGGWLRMRDYGGCER